MYVCFGYVLSLSLERRMRSLCLAFAFVWFVLKAAPRFWRWKKEKRNSQLTLEVATLPARREIFNAHLTFALTFSFLFQVFFECISHRKLLFNCNTMLACLHFAQGHFANEVPFIKLMATPCSFAM